jgi:hypothetical protein
MSPQTASLLTARHSNFICLSTSYADTQLTVLDVAALALDFASRYRGCRKRKVELTKGHEFQIITALLDTPGFTDIEEDTFPEVFQQVGTANFSRVFLEYSNTHPYALRSVATFMNTVLNTVQTGVGSNFYQRAAARLRSKIVFLPQMLSSGLGDYPLDDMSFIHFHNQLFKI